MPKHIKAHYLLITIKNPQKVIDIHSRVNEQRKIISRYDVKAEQNAGLIDLLSDFISEKNILIKYRIVSVPQNNYKIHLILNLQCHLWKVLLPNVKSVNTKDTKQGIKNQISKTVWQFP